MSKHEELIKSLRASAAAMPFDAAVAVQYRAAADALEAQAREIEGLRTKAERCAADEALIKRLRNALDQCDYNIDEAIAAISAADIRLGVNCHEQTTKM